jgi:hypothetical protein
MLTLLKAIWSKGMATGSNSATSRLSGPDEKVKGLASLARNRMYA